MTSNNPQPPLSSFNSGGGGGGVSGSWPQYSTEEPNTYQPFENEHPSKRARSDSANKAQVQANGSMQPMNPSNMGTGYGNRHIFYKTRICQPFIEGKCWLGDRCTFAHGQDDLRDSLQNWQETKKGAVNRNNEDERIIQRMRICRKFYNGEACPYGDQCNFLHEEPVKFRAADMNMMGNRNNSDRIDVNSSAFGKTRLCSKWEETGFCPLGEGCHFAHGVLELQQPGIGSIDEAENVVIAPTQSKPDVGWKPKWKKPKKINGIYGDWIEGAESPPRW